MDQDAGKTRAELLGELADLRDEHVTPEAIEAIFPLLSGTGSERLGFDEAKRLEREYLLLCGRNYSPVTDPTVCVARAGHLENREEGKTSSCTEPDFDPLCERLDEAAGEGGLDVLFQAVADEAAALMEVELSLLAIVDADGERFTYRGVAGLKAQSLLGETEYIESASVCGWVLRQRTHFVAADVRTDLRGVREIRNVLKARSVAAAPLDGREGIIGAIAVAGPKKGGCSSDRLVRERLLPFARHVSAVLLRARSSRSRVLA